MKLTERYTLDRKRIVNTRVSEEEYGRLRDLAMAMRVSLSFLMRQGLEPYIRPSGGGGQKDGENNKPTEGLT